MGHSERTRAAVLVTGAMMLLLLNGCAMFTARDQVYMRKGTLMRGTQPLTLRAVESQVLMGSQTEHGDVVETLNRAAAHGADAVWFDLPTASVEMPVSEATRERIRMIVFEAAWRRLGIVCRVFGDADPTAGVERARALARALRRDHELVYWIDAEAGIVHAFRGAAPRLVTAAAEGADLRISREDPVPSSDPEGVPDPVIFVMESADEAIAKGAHFAVLGGEETCAALDRALADPREAQPWDPDNSVLSEAERADGWIALFNGRDLDGWVVTGANPQGFAAEDGMIVWKGPGGGVLRSHDRYTDFVLRFEWRIGSGGNSGVFLRAPRTGRASKIGMEFQLMGDYGVQAHANGTGAIYDVVAPKENASRPAGEWNEVEIELVGGKLRAAMNGRLLHDLDLDANAELRHRLRGGFIGLQDHNHPVAFRNIRIKPL